MKTRINLNTCRNNLCKTNCNKSDRKFNSEDDLCKITHSELDSLPIRCVGSWAEQKIYMLSQYFGIFATGMKNKWETNYIEICSGPGRCVNRKDGTEFDGTPMAILKHPAFKYIHKALFFDYNRTVVSTLNSRIQNLKIVNACAYQGDYNNPDEILEIIKQDCSIGRNLNLVLIDPTDCSVPFKMVNKIKQTLQKVDMIINIATGTDLNRNLPMAFENPDYAQKYNNFLGNNTFFVDPKNINLFKQGNYEELRNNFRNLYQKSMEEIGYSVFRIKSVRHYYNLLFAASHERAAEFWDKAQRIQYDGQRTLF